MARVAFVISLVALLIAVLAYKESGGSRALEEHVRSLQGAVEAARRETADALGRLERTLRTSDGGQTAPGKSNP